MRYFAQFLLVLLVVAFVANIIGVLADLVQKI